MTARAVEIGAQLEIPQDVQPGTGWTAQMLELADHIGPYLTLRLVERYGGQQKYISRQASDFVELLGEKAADTFGFVYGGRPFQFPVGRAALQRAYAQPLIAAVLAGTMPAAEAGRRLGTSRTHMTYLVNQARDGGCEAMPRRIGRTRPVDPRQIDMFGQALPESG